MRAGEGHEAGAGVQGLNPTLRDLDSTPQIRGSKSFGFQGPLRVERIWGTDSGQMIDYFAK